MRSYHVISRNDDVSKGVEELIHQRLEPIENRDEKNPDTVFVVGGDGTFLMAVHRYLDQLDAIRFMAVHTGTLGFFSDYLAEEIEDCLDDYLNREPMLLESRLLGIKVEGQTYYALNELRIENVYRTQIIDVYIDDVFFETFRGTGLCVSTQQGSTAYNRSLGGAILFEGLSLLQLSEVTGIHHCEFRSLRSPLVLSGDAQIMLKGRNFEKAVLCYDHLTMDLSDQLAIRCFLSQKKVRFARYRKVSYLERLKHLF